MARREITILNFFYDLQQHFLSACVCTHMPANFRWARSNKPMLMSRRSRFVKQRGPPTPHPRIDMTAIFNLLSSQASTAYRRGWNRLRHSVRAVAARFVLPEPATVTTNALQVSSANSQTETRSTGGSRAEGGSKILFIDDEPTAAATFTKLFVNAGYEVSTATSGAEGLAAAAKGDFQVVVTDLKMPGTSGMEVIEKLHATKPLLPVILMTGHHTAHIAIQAIKLGAYDYVVKPPVPDELLEVVKNAIAAGKPAPLPPEPVESVFTGEMIIGSSPVMQNVCKEIGRVAPMPVTVLIRGETGTGKELVAHAIHEHSDRPHGPFIEVECARLPEAALESELFGQEPGAFSGADSRRIGRFEQANHGTIFFDEIGDLSPCAQTQLLVFLQNRAIQRGGGVELIPLNVRVIAVTHDNLEAAMAEGRFRADLYHRLNEAVISIRPLREHREDIPDLVRMLMRRCSAEFELPPSMPTDDAMAWLQEQPWPGNVRELRNVIRRALLRARGHLITREMVADNGHN
jgi:DNA-binding NtrC family response regulator